MNTYAKAMIETNALSANVYTATHSTSDYGEKVEVGLCCSVDSISNCSSNPPDALLPRSSGLGTASDTAFSTVLSHKGTHCLCSRGHTFVLTIVHTAHVCIGASAFSVLVLQGAELMPRDAAS
jgi:hypothetical protein